ncbi:hypothetical protein [Microvirga massiliensis]|uniref:hypothetical protein n=1 Tax=Microvirga massiliensis TaxID=1033741 RepID=UPI00062BD2E5|nr:hypothetical protein [Microvirga massiliensis]
MKRKTDPRNETKLQELRAKALRRGEKMANTLRKLAAKGDPNDASVGSLLKELEQALPRLRRLSGQQDGRLSNRDARRVEGDSGKTGDESPFPPKSSSRRDKRQSASNPAIAE